MALPKRVSLRAPASTEFFLGRSIILGGRMSFEAAGWAIKQRTKTPTEKLVLIAIADCQNADSGLCYPSIPYLADKAQCSERQVTRCVSALESQGLLLVKRTTGKSNHYRLIMTPDDKMSVVPNEPETPDICDNTPDTDDGRPPTPMSSEPVINQEENQVTKKTAPKKKCKIPADLFLTKHNGNLAVAYWRNNHRLDLDPRQEFDRFHAHHTAKGTLMLDWDAAWKTWYMNAIKFNKAPGGQNGQSNIDWDSTAWADRLRPDQQPLC